MHACIIHNLGGSSKDSGKENILFSALAKFMKKSALSSLSEIERCIAEVTQRHIFECCTEVV